MSRKLLIITEKELLQSRQCHSILCINLIIQSCVYIATYCTILCLYVVLNYVEFYVCVCCDGFMLTLQVLGVHHRSWVWTVALDRSQHVCGCGHRHCGRIHKTENYRVSASNEGSTRLTLYLYVCYKEHCAFHFTSYSYRCLFNYNTNLKVSSLLKLILWVIIVRPVCSSIL